MGRVLTLLLIATVLLPLATGTVAVVAGFGDPWGMGAKNPWGVFVTAALPILPPGFYQVLAWPLTFGIALLLSPLALLRRRMTYPMVVLPILAAIAGGWLYGWIIAPDYLNTLLDGKSYVPGRLNSDLWKFGVLLLTDAAVVSAALGWWCWRERALEFKPGATLEPGGTRANNRSRNAP
jgi:hypothetical protein